MECTWKSMPVTFSITTKKSLKKLKFSHATPVQAACIPIFMGNKDVAVEAVTGSGKTLAFVIPILEKLQKIETLKKHEIFSVILTPTRELASQIEEVLNQFTKWNSDISTILFIGGDSLDKNIDNFTKNGGNIVVATPGRFEALLDRKKDLCPLSSCVKSLEILILDEADRLLEMGFEASINTILSYLPKQRRTGLFSATQTDEVEALIRAGLRNPIRINVKEKQTQEGGGIRRTPSTLKNLYMLADSDEKFNQLVNFLDNHSQEKIMVFFSTCAGVDYFSRGLQHVLKDLQILFIHGKMKQKRNKVFSKFRSRESGVLACTDVMARGVDIPEVDWVIQYDPPSSANAFIHRCGRTARIGNKGNALIFLLPAEDSYVKFIEINQKAPLQQIEKTEDVENCLPALQNHAKKDREFFEKGARAYVSFVQSYLKHECNMIFRIKNLDFGKLATGFGLLRIPKMPELKGKTVPNFELVEFDASKIPYRDKVREKQRLEKLKKEKDENKKPKLKRPPRSVPWSQNKGKMERKKVKKEKREKGKKRKLEMTEGDIDDLDKDLKLMKKLKKGKISMEDFDKEFADDD